MAETGGDVLKLPVTTTPYGDSYLKLLVSVTNRYVPLPLLFFKHAGPLTSNIFRFFSYFGKVLEPPIGFSSLFCFMFRIMMILLESGVHRDFFRKSFLDPQSIITL
jgi:hypothetical protein